MLSEYSDKPRCTDCQQHCNCKQCNRKQQPQTLQPQTLQPQTLQPQTLQLQTFNCKHCKMQTLQPQTLQMQAEPKDYSHGVENSTVLLKRTLHFSGRDCSTRQQRGLRVE